MSNATGQMTLTKLCDKGLFAQELLEKDDCFILDNGSNGKIYVWKGDCVYLFICVCSKITPFLIIALLYWRTGNGANLDEKRVAMKVADEFITEMNYPRMRTQVCFIFISVHRNYDLFIQLSTFLYLLRWKFSLRDVNLSSSNSSSRAGVKHTNM